MKKIWYWLIGLIITVVSFLTGFLIRQPQVNKLKKQVELLQRDSRKLLALIEAKQSSYQELLIQHKALKALQFRKKSTLQEQMTENLIMQYAIKAYLVLLLKSGRHELELTKTEIVFLKAFEKVIDGKKLSTTDKVKIRDYIMERHGREIKQLKECEYTAVLKEIQEKPKYPEFIFCILQIDKKKKPQYYITDDESVLAGDMVCIPAGKKKTVVVEVLFVERHTEATAPIAVDKAPRIICKYTDGDSLPARDH